MGAPGRRRWPRRLAVTAAAIGLVAVLREQRLAANAKRYDLPG